MKEFLLQFPPSSVDVICSVQDSSARKLPLSPRVELELCAVVGRRIADAKGPIREEPEF